MPKKRTTRVFWRDRGGHRRAYVDLRDLGGGREALVLPGESTATTDPDIAAELAAQRVREFEAQRRRTVITGIANTAGLRAYAVHHIREKSSAGQTTHGCWIVLTEKLDKPQGGVTKQCIEVTLSKKLGEICTRTKECG